MSCIFSGNPNWDGWGDGIHHFKKMFAWVYIPIADKWVPLVSYSSIQEIEDDQMRPQVQNKVSLRLLLIWEAEVSSQPNALGHLAILRHEQLQLFLFHFDYGKITVKQYCLLVLYTTLNSTNHWTYHSFSSFFFPVFSILRFRVKVQVDHLPKAWYTQSTLTKSTTWTSLENPSLACAREFQHTWLKKFMVSSHPTVHSKLVLVELSNYSQGVSTENTNAQRCQS